ncbi:sensor histidine kinase [Actinophytocola sp.]|uniref:sensor histidine kinase n=1 Tax=Actinophytocola sp. TaxID=1872138 RepID=UPI002ED51444
MRTRLALTFGGLFLLAGAILLVVNYALVSQSLPSADSFSQQFVSGEGGEDKPDESIKRDSAEDPPPPVGAAGGANILTNTVGGAVSGYRESALQTMVIISGIALVLVGAMAALLGWLMADRTLRPVKRITATARRLEAGQMDKRINLEGPEDELKELADTFDSMLDRLAGSFDSQRRFVANASHELRTPLAVQRTMIEVAMADPTASPDLMRLGAHLLHTNERVERLIEGLLLLARSDRGLNTREPVRLDLVVAAVLDGARHLADDAGVTLASHLAPRVVPGDPVLLERLVTNLVHNGIHYNERGGSVTVEVGEFPALVVVNTGSVVPPDQVNALFEPFRRLDRDRTARQAGAGLGLSIVRSVVKAHDGTVSAAPNPGGGLRVTAKLPVHARSVTGDTVDPRVSLGTRGGD